MSWTVRYTCNELGPTRSKGEPPALFLYLLRIVHLLSLDRPLQLPPAGVACTSAPACYQWTPPPIPPTPWFSRPTVVLGLLAFIAAVQLILCVLVSVFVIVFRDALNHSSPAFLMLVNAGALLYSGTSALRC